MKIKIEQISCNFFGLGPVLTEFLKKTLQEKGFNIVTENPDMIINSAVTVTPSGQAVVGKGILLAGLSTALIYLLGKK